MLPKPEFLVYDYQFLLFYRAKGNEQDAAWDWLAENNTNNSPSSTSVDAAWHLLKELVLALEVKGQSGLKKAVATRLLTLNTPLPAWLVTGKHAYKIGNRVVWG